MSTNISKQKREDLLNKIKEIRNYIAASPQDENTDCEDVDAYKRVFQMIFEPLGQSQHYKIMIGKRIKS